MEREERIAKIAKIYSIFAKKELIKGCTVRFWFDSEPEMHSEKTFNSTEEELKSSKYLIERFEKEGIQSGVLDYEIIGLPIYIGRILHIMETAEEVDWGRRSQISVIEQWDNKEERLEKQGDKIIDYLYEKAEEYEGMEKINK